MPKVKTPGIENTSITLAGIAEIPVDLLRSLEPTDFNKNGVVLCNERLKVRIMHGQVPVTYTVSMYAQRDAISDDETAQVASVKEERKLSAQEKLEEEARKTQRNLDASFRLGQDSTMHALRNVAGLSDTIKAIKSL